MDDKGADDAIRFNFDKIYEHLEKPKSHVRLLFSVVFFPSAFSKMQPHILIKILGPYFNLPD